MKITKYSVSGVLIWVISLSGFCSETLRILTWGGYAPASIVQKFEKETGIKVKVTLSNNEEMIAKLRATGGSGFDLAQPSHDRIQSAQQEYQIYQPIELARIQKELFDSAVLEATLKAATLGADLYAVPFIWGTNGLIVHQGKASVVQDYTDLCRPEVSGKVSYRLRRPTLISFAFALGEDPFAAYSDLNHYQGILDKVEKALIQCKQNVKTYWSGADVLLNLMRSGEVVAALGWDTTGWKLHAENKDIIYRVPRSGALGWIDTFALPKRAKNRLAAYRWIQFVMQPAIAAELVNEIGNFVAAKDIPSHPLVASSLKQNFADSFPGDTFKNVRWYPPVPPGFETYEGKVLDRIQVARAS
ncbi:MAG: extracellular solute-binding protein [Gammaproteobacteria bacterium]|nr:extracellular solute-binding protein [Gammaproteobacteria bacterium]